MLSIRTTAARFALLAHMLILIPVSSLAEVAGATVNVSFDAPAMPANEIKSYKIYCSTIKGGPYALSAEVSGSPASVPNCKPAGTTGSAYFVALTVSLDGRESAYSNEAVRTWVAAAPEAPTMAACAPPVVKMTVAPRTGYTDRPLFADITLKKEIGRILIGQPCEDETLLKTATGERRWATNGKVKGVALCK